MASTSTYLNFNRQTEEAFYFYKAIFKTEFEGKIARFGDYTSVEGYPPVAEPDKNLIMNIALPTVGGHIIMGTDAPESMGMKLIIGNNISICLQPDTRNETDRLYQGLSEGGKQEMPLQEMFWGDYFGTCVDKFGVQWMFNCSSKV